MIPAPNGNQIPLSQVANVSLVNSPSQIQREDTKRRILVGFNVGGRDVESIVTELQEKVRAEIKLPTGYTITYGGSFENLNEAKSRLMVAVPVSLILIFLLLYFAFGSIKYGLLIYTAIPLSAIGGIFLLALRGLPFSISAGVGFIALFGIAVLNGIVLVAEFNNIKKTGEQDMKKIVLKGTKTRLRPVLMTAFVASLGFLPMAISNGAGASVQRPLATVVIGGLMIATLLTLFVLPILYVSFEKGIFEKKKLPKIATLVLVLIGFFVSSANAQTPITLDAALDSLYKNNISLRTGQLKAEYSRQLSKTATNVAPLNVSAEYGKYNSSMADNKLSISQSFSLPGVYARQKDKLLEEWKTSLLEKELDKAELTKATTQVFYDLLVVEKLRQLYLEADSSYCKLRQLAVLRLKSGESNLLEKASAENQLLQVSTKLKNLKIQESLLQQQLAFLLNTNVPLSPEADALIVKPVFSDTLGWTNHPQIKLLQQQQKVAFAITRVEQSKLLPEINVGYNNTTLKDGINFGRSDRFQSFQLGLGIPLFGGSQRNRVGAARTYQEFARSETENATKQLHTGLQSAHTQYRQQSAMVESLEKDGLNTAGEITSTLSKQLKNGAINYLEWTMLNNEAINIRESYFTAIQQLNRTITELNYLLAQ
ncbi:MAG: hypothetical protein EOO45_14885 [Flavobacterium sp.]|nr:MAG: hypothetical protein EOO45_14885 [Flavobacterium sp.]